tara:strand:- start:602 stop:862 length:261 start_codon:yes stop_codon:yes gene_type:complete
MNNLKKIMPLLHKLLAMIFLDMKKNGFSVKEIEWYSDTIAALLASAMPDIYKDKNEFNKYMDEFDDDFNKFEYKMEKDILKPKAKA